jgi:hypothetical protein
LVWQLVILNGEKPDGKVAFPVWRTATEATPKEIHKRLRKLALNTDKHRVLHPVNGYMRGNFVPANLRVLDRNGRPRSSTPSSRPWSGLLPPSTRSRLG